MSFITAAITVTSDFEGDCPGCVEKVFEDHFRLVLASNPQIERGFGGFNSNCSWQASPTLGPSISAYTVDHAKSTNSAGHIAAYRPSQRSAGPDLGAGSGGALHRAGFYARSDEADRRSRQSPHTLG